MRFGIVKRLSIGQSAGKILKGLITMLIPNQLITTRANRDSLSHYQLKGYNFTVNEMVTVRAEDLPLGSGKKVKVQCDYCGKEIEKTFVKYIQGRKKIEKDACQKCAHAKQSEICQLEHGVKNIMHRPEIQQSLKQGMLRKHGIDNPMHSPVFRQSFVQSMQKKYGVSYAQQNPEIRAKTLETLQTNYGVNHPSQSKECQRKLKESMRFVNGVRVSKGQIQLGQHVGGQINCYVDKFCVDIVLPESKLVIEYDGSGHDLAVTMGDISASDFQKKELTRYEQLQSLGWRVVVVKNQTDKRLTPDRLQHFSKWLDNNIKSFAIYTV